MEKIFKQKNFNHFVCAPLGSRVNIYINFCLQVYFKVSAAWYCSHYLPPVSTTPVANTRGTGGKICRWCHWYRWQICRRCHWYRRNLPPVSLTPAANLPPVSLTPVVHLDLRISPRTSKKFEMNLMLFSGAWGKVIHEKNLKQKSRDNVPLM